MSVQEREGKQLGTRASILKRDIEQIKVKIATRKAEGEHLAGNSSEFQKILEKYEELT